MGNIGILGGTFDPIHYGHLSIVDGVIAEHSFNHIILMPAKVSPFKLGQKVAAEKHRVAMTEAAAKGYKNLSVSLLEINRGTVSYTYDTLMELSQIYPNEKLWFIMGADSMLSLESWNKGKELLKNFSFVLAPRPGYDINKTKRIMQRYRQIYGTEILVIHNKLMDISSTEIKRRIKEGKSISNLVPKEVENYIYEHKLYKGIYRR